ncbi:MAG TPA: biosynthetic-type acetolactate synthase large subunit [Syntrophaceae bacterium]|jgi:acetolactate synthase-1/2/3 large subunit|nr:biosynthetic-type acetolactate synthase large subunit [Syntrophaceae bacterium]
MENIGADIIIQILKEEGVDVIFGYPGANTLPLHDRLTTSHIRHYLMRHEQAAAHAADGYARATGKVGVCLATSGPGATNLVTGIATAYMDSTPLIALTAQVSTALLGQDAFQETDIIGITMPITKHSYQVHDVHDIAQTLRHAFELAKTGRPGPVLIDLPRDILAAKCEQTEEKSSSTLKKNGNAVEDQEQLEKIAKALNQSERPILIIGGGVKLSNAFDLIRELIAKAKIPFVTTMMGVGSVDSANGYNLGLIGTHGNELANKMVHQCDFMLAIGTRFSDRSTAQIEEFAPLAKIAQIDIDPTSIGKSIKINLPYVGDIRETLTALLPLIDKKEKSDWLQRIDAERDAIEHKVSDGGCGQAGNFIRMVQESMPRETTVTADVGLNQIWTIRTWKARGPRSLITSGGMGTMGFSLPASIGVKVGAPERAVVAIMGDGGFYMNIQELATIGYYNLPIKIIVINNGHLGMIRQIQHHFYNGRFNTIDLGRNVDFIAVAKGFGIPGCRIDVEKDPRAGIAEMVNTNGPFLLEALVDPENYVYPIIPPGCSNIEMMYERLD